MRPPPLSDIVGEFKRDPYAIISTETLDKLAKALGVPSSTLIEDVPEE